MLSCGNRAVQQMSRRDLLKLKLVYACILYNVGIYFWTFKWSAASNQRKGKLGKFVLVSLVTEDNIIISGIFHIIIMTCSVDGKTTETSKQRPIIFENWVSVDIKEYEVFEFLIYQFRLVLLKFISPWLRNLTPNCS